MAMASLRDHLRMRAADPRRALRDTALLLGGLFIFAMANVFSLHCNLGASSWTVLHDGVSQRFPLTIGQAAQLVGLVMLGVAWLAGVAPGIGTFANMLLIGFFMDAIIWSGAIPKVEPYPLRVLWLLLGAGILGIGSAMYIKAGFGAGPRDSFMLAVVRRTGLRVGRVRWMMEFTAVIFGALLGGAFGIGTIIFALCSAPSVEFFFKIFNVKVTRPSESTPVPAAD